MGSTRYITSMGELTRKDNSLCFRKEGKNVYIPVENTKEILERLSNDYEEIKIVNWEECKKKLDNLD